MDLVCDHHGSPYDGQSYRQGDRSLLVQYPSCSSIEEFLSKEE